MRTNLFKTALAKLAMAGTVLLSLAGVHAQAATQTVGLTAAPSTATLADGNVVPMWGYTCGTVSGGSGACTALNPAVAAGTVTGWSPVVITVATGDTLVINLTNNLSFGGNSVPTSLTIVGQLGGGLGGTPTTTPAPDHSLAQTLTWPIPDSTAVGAPPPQGPRIQSFGTEVAPGATTTLTWANLLPGTYLIESGTHPSIQGPMGLYGMLVVTDKANGVAYGTVGSTTASTYNGDVPLLFSEIDPVQNAAVNLAVNTVGFSETMVWSGLTGGCGNPASTTYGQCYPPAVNYSPRYFLINGSAFDATHSAASFYAVTPAGVGTTSSTSKILLRMVNAGLKMHVPSAVGALTSDSTGAANGTGMTLVAEDGNVLPGLPRVQSEVFMAAGKTYDVSVNLPSSTAPLPIFDRELSLSTNAVGRNGGMLAYVGQSVAALPTTGAFGAKAAAVDDPYNVLVAGQTFTLSDPSKGLISNDTGVYGVTLLAQAANGTVTLNRDGTFTYVPTGTATSDSFTYCANGSVTGGVCSSGIQATVTLGASSVVSADANGVTCSATSFTSNVATYYAAKTPGVLAGCTDKAGLPLTVDLATVSGPAGLVADASGGFALSVAGAGTQTFTFKAKNSVGVESAATTVTVVFPTPSNLQVSVVDGKDHVTPITDYRWIIEEDRTFYVDPACTSNPLPAACPTATPDGSPVNYGTNFHTSAMQLVAAGCTGDQSCESGQTLQGVNAVCDVGNGACRTDATKQVAVNPSQVHLDPSKRYYISVLPGDAATPFNNGYTGAPDCTAAGVAAGSCGHGMGGAPVAAACGFQSTSKAACTATTALPAVTVLAVPTPLPTATLTVIVYEDDYPLNGEQDSGGGVDVLATQEPGLGDFQVTIYDQAGGTGDATGTPTYDMSNQPLANSLAGTIDPVTGLDACPISSLIPAAKAFNAANAAAIAAGTINAQSTSTGMIVTCPKYEADGQTLSPMVGQAVVKNLYPGRYGVAALPGAGRIARGEEWVQTNTLDGQKAHDSFMRVGEPGYFQEFGPAGYHVSIGFANPKIINDRRTNATHTGMCDPGVNGGGLSAECKYEVKGHVYGSRLSRTPDQRLYSSGSRDALAFTQCYVSLGDPDGADFFFQKCDGDGGFDFTNIPPGNWKVTTFDQWNDQIIDGITQPVSVGCSGNIGGLCDSGNVSASIASTCVKGSTATMCDMGEIGVHQWQADLYTRSFIDLAGTGVSDDSKPGLALVATNVRFRDGSFSNFNSTDLDGYATFNEVFPLFNWYTVETDSTRYKTTGVHVIYDAGGPADGSPSCSAANNALCGASSTAANLANTYEKYPLPADLSVPGAVYCATGNADCVGESIANGPKPSSLTTYSTGRIDPPTWFDSYGWQGYIGQGNFLEWGKKPYAAGETGGIQGHVVYASTRPFDDPQLLLQLSWEPLVAHVTVNLYKEGFASDGVTPTLTLVDHTITSSWDDWAQGFRSDGKPNMNCPGQQGSTDPFYYGLKNQPQYLDWYNSMHGGAAPTALPYNAQYKCYDGMHTWNQLQPAPYDGKYSFPSVTGINPTTGKPSGTNCTACVGNPDTTDPFRSGMPMLPPGKYVVEVVVPAGYELVKEEDKNILIGDNYIAPADVQFPGLAGAVYILPDQAELAAANNPTNPQNSTTSLGRNSSLPSHEGDTGSIETYWPCVGAVRQVPDYISLFPQSGEVSPFAGAMRPLCDRKEVTLTEQASALVKFYVFSSTHLSSHFQGIILDDFAAEFDPFSPQFGEKFAPSYLPVGVKDWTGNPINRVYADQFGLYNGLNYSTWEVNPPNPTGYGPTMMVMCMNDSGMNNAVGTNFSTPDPLFQPGYSQFCYELPFMPGQTGYFDTPVVPVQAFASGSYNRPDCNYPDATPAIAKVEGDTIGSTGVKGPWVSGAGKPIVITALGNQSIDWYGFSGPWITTTPYNQTKITRTYGFGGTAGTVSIGGITIPAANVSWAADGTTITVTPTATTVSSIPACAVQQQAQYGGPSSTANYARCGQLVVTTAAGRQSVDSVTVTFGGKAPSVVAAGTTIQSAIDAASPGDMILVPAGTYNEMVVMWKPVRLQGVGAATTVVDANTQPAGRLLNPWRSKVVALFGLTPDGRPDTTGLNAAQTCVNHTPGGCNFPKMTVDRLPFEATLGWDATLNGNLAEQLIEPSLLGAYEGAAITVLGKGVKFPSNTGILDAYGATTGTPGASFPTNTALLSASDCGGTTSKTPANPYPSNFYCNPSSIDGLGIRDSSQGGGGIFVHAYAHNLQIANNRVSNNTGTMSGGITIGTGEHPDVALGGAGALITTYPTSCETSNITNLGLPFCFNMRVNIHNNAVVGNSSMGDELFSSTPAGAGGVSINTGADYYTFANNWICGNLSSGDGGGVSHIGFIKNGKIANNTILFNQSTNPSITTNGGGLLVMGAPDADPTTCGVANDQDCVPPPSTITPSDGTGPGLTIDANLILGNAADSGSGGGLRIQHASGTDVLNIPGGLSACTADLGVAGGSRSFCRWNSINVTNNIVVNNVAGWDGGGVSLLDALAVNFVNNTVASNDSTASSGTLLQSLFAPLASAASPTSNVTCAGGGQSCPQVAGLVSVNNSPVLQANIDALGSAFSCPLGHGFPGTSTTKPTCYYNPIPLMGNNVIWQNRSFYIGVGGLGSATANQNQQNVVTLYPKGSTTAAANQTATGACPAGSAYWDLGFRGDTGVTSHATSGFAPMNSVLTASYGGTGNATSTPNFVSQYCNGSRQPPELGAGGYAVPPGVNEFNAFPNPVFTLLASGVVDEGNNWINVRWGPLALTSPASGAVLGNYAPQGGSAGSSAIDHGVASVPALVATGQTATSVAAPKTDFFGTTRPKGSAYDIGAVEYQPSTVPVVAVSPTSLTYTTTAGTTSAAQTLTLSNSGGATFTGIAVGVTGTGFARAGGTCGTTLNAGANCTITVTFSPAATATGTVTGSVAIAGSNATVTGSPVSLTGNIVAAVSSVTFTPTSWTVSQTRNCPGTGVAGRLACGLDPAQIFTLTNTGNVPVTNVAQAALGGTAANQADYAVVRAASTCGPAGNGQLALTAVTTLAPGQSCIVTVQFKPLTSQATGLKSATISVTDSLGTQTSTLNGTAN